jgi:hypothetical protein
MVLTIGECEAARQDCIYAKCHMINGDMTTTSGAKPTRRRDKHHTIVES